MHATLVRPKPKAPMTPSSAHSILDALHVEKMRADKAARSWFRQWVWRGRFTGRARAMAIICIVQYAGIGYWCRYDTGRGPTAAFDPITAVMPLQWWAWCFFAASVAIAAALWYAEEWPLRLTILFSLGLTFFWSAGLGAARLEHKAALTGVVMWAACAAKDVVLLSMPMKLPLVLLDD